MNVEKKFLLVDKDILPSIFSKVINVKKNLELGKYSSVNEATKAEGIGRSAYYKYKDHVFPFYESTRGKVITLYFVVEDFSGILSSIINVIAKANGNILTINQNIPINGLADVTISLDTRDMTASIEEFLVNVSLIKGVTKTEILSRET